MFLKNKLDLALQWQDQKNKKTTKTKTQLIFNERITKLVIRFSSYSYDNQNHTFQIETLPKRSLVLLPTINNCKKGHQKKC